MNEHELLEPLVFICIEIRTLDFKVHRRSLGPFVRIVRYEVNLPCWVGSESRVIAKVLLLLFPRGDELEEESIIFLVKLMSLHVAFLGFILHDY